MVRAFLGGDYVGRLERLGLNLLGLGFVCRLRGRYMVGHRLRVSGLAGVSRGIFESPLIAM